jgi:two-component SAPR family response regulator
VIGLAREINPRITALLISGQDIRRNHEDTLPNVELLRKPFSQRQLAMALQRARRSNVVDDAIERE